MRFPLLVAGAFACLSFSANASQCESETLSQVAALIDSEGGKIIAIVDAKATDFDQIVIAEFRGGVVVGRFKDGCAIGAPVHVGVLSEEIGA